VTDTRGHRPQASLRPDEAGRCPHKTDPGHRFSLPFFFFFSCPPPHPSTRSDGKLGDDLAGKNMAARHRTRERPFSSSW